MAGNNPKKQLQNSKNSISEVELMPQNSDTGHLINQTIVQILVEKDNPDEIKDLMRAELDYNRERLEILREHTQLHPDAIEDRKTKSFRRTQYAFLMFFLLCLIGAIFFTPVTTSLPLSAIAMIVTSGVVLNGRDRDNDSEALISILNKLIKRSQ